MRVGGGSILKFLVRWGGRKKLSLGLRGEVAVKYIFVINSLLLFYNRWCKI